MKNNCATVILTAACGLFAFVPTVDAAGWAVIAEDPKFPTDDVIVAFCSVTDSQYKLPADPSTSDCTPAIQRALDDASAAGGGTVFLPEGRYRLEGMLTIASNVFLRGRWSPIGPNRPAAGTILMIQNQEHEQSVLLTGSGCGVRDLTFWHPDQQVTESTDAKSLAESPLVIRGQASVVTIENITLVNPGRGIDLSQASTCCLRGIYGSPLHSGLSADRSFAVSRYDSIHFSPDYWTWSGLPGSPPEGGAHADYMRKHGTGLHIYEMDGFYAGFSKISGYQKGLHFERGVSGDDASGELSYFSVTDCDTALHVDDAKGFRIVGSTLQGSEYGIWGKDRTHYKIHTTNIAGGKRSISIRNGIAELVNCTVTGETEILGRRTVYREHQYDEKLPAFRNAYDRIRKPAKVNLFNVLDYGAVGDGKADDTQALKKAIEAAAANGGGIVLVPDGEYRITEALDLGDGVELRGNSGGRHGLSNKRGAQLGSVLFIETGEGEENGTPFLTLGDGSGLRGMGFYYPNQDYKSFRKYPWMVRANGTGNYVIDCSASNPYQGLELNGDEHLVEYSFIGGLRRTYRANHCSGGRIQNCHIKPDFWRNAWLPSSPKTAELEEFKFRVNEAFEPIYLNGCDDYVLMSLYNHASHTFMTVDDSSGQALMVGGEQLQQGYAFRNGARSFDIISSTCNINHIGGRDGTYGIKTFPGFNGEARFYCSLAMGTSDETWNAQGGHLFCQLTSITGPSNRGANSIHCGPGARITAQSGGCASHVLGFEIDGRVSFEDFHFAKGFLRSAAAEFQVDNRFDKVYVLSDANQPVPKAYGLKLDQSNVRMEDALIVPNSGLAKDSQDGRRLPAARLTEGNSYSLNVTDPGFQNGSIAEVEITLYFRVDTTCTIQTFYRSKTGMKLGDTVDFQLKDKPFWKEHRFRVSDAHFDSEDDLRINVKGKSPLLAMVVIAAPANTNADSSNKASKGSIQEFQFVDRLERMPLPIWEPESRNFLSNLAHVGTFNVIPEELNQGQRAIVHSVEFEAPYFEEYPPKSHRRIFVSREPREILEQFLTRAWRRPPTDDELTLMLRFQKEIRETDHPDSFEASILETLVIALTSPQFLYIHEPVPDDEPRPLTDYELASRLSYFLWNTMPDEVLLRLASRGELRGQLDSQIDRMLADERSWGFVRNFVDQWLDVSRMDRVVVQRRRDWTPEVAKDAKLETIHFFAELLRSNGSVLELIDSDWVMTNQNLAQFYRDLEDAEIEGDEFRRVSLPENHRRGGVLTHASILTGHSSGVDSHPVKRGVWLTKRVLATPPPPAPPGVPPLDEEDPELQKLSIRKQLELHRDNAACSNCHQRIDPWGVAMEEFDTIGMYRRRDATAVLPNGDTITGMEGLKGWLLENRKRDVTRSVVRHLTAWALGRSLSFADNSLIDEMVNEVEADEYRIQTAIRAIVQNELFLNR